jgi:hypothetical protein
MASKKKPSGLIQWSETFDTRIYPLKAIRQAIKDYSSLGTFTIHEKDGKVEVKAAIEAESDFHFRQEFANYVLGMTIKCK